MRVVTLKGPITKPLEIQINIVTMFVSRKIIKLINDHFNKNEPSG